MLPKLAKSNNYNQKPTQVQLINQFKTDPTWKLVIVKTLMHIIVIIVVK